MNSGETKEPAARTTVSMPEPMMKGAQERVRVGNFSTFSAYVQDLIRRDLGKQAEKQEPKEEVAA
jgi:Arc/MetJ-type ribon-helix-helix transcriptional regulator